MQRVERIGNLDRFYTADTAADVNMDEARRIFDCYKQDHVICNSCFEDPVWILSDERKRIKIHFSLQSDVYEATGAKWLHCDYAVFMDASRIFLLFNMGVFALNHLKEMIDTCLQLGRIPLNQS